MNEVKFELKNTKLYASSLVFALLSMMCVFVFFQESDDEAFISLNPLISKGASVISLVVFLAILYYCVKLIAEKRVGLTIDDKGITDNSSALSLGFIAWRSVKKAKVESIEGARFLLVELSDLDKYLKDENDYIARLLKENIKNYDYPVAIGLSSLKGNAKDTETAIRSALKKYQD